MNDLRIVAFDEVGRVAHPFEELLQFVFWDTREETGVRNLVAVQVQNREHAAVAGGVGVSPLLWLLLVVALVVFFTGGGFGYRRGGRV